MTPSIAAIPPFSFGVHYCLFTRTMVRRAGEVPLPLTAHARDRMTKPGRTQEGDAASLSSLLLLPDSGLPVLRKGKKHDRHLSLSLSRFYFQTDRGARFPLEITSKINMARILLHQSSAFETKCMKCGKRYTIWKMKDQTLLQMTLVNLCETSSNGVAVGFARPQSVVVRPPSSIRRPGPWSTNFQKRGLLLPPLL